MPLETNVLGERLYRRAEKLKSKRMSVFDPQWQKLSQYFWPDVSDINTEKTESTDDWFSRIFSSRPIRASQTCSVGVRNWVTPSTDPWLGMAPPYNLKKVGQKTNPRMSRLSAPQAEVGDDGKDDATRWCDEVAAQLLEWYSESNFYSVIQNFNRSGCVFGTALMYMDEGEDTTFNFEQFKVGTYCISENKEKIVDTVQRWFKFTVRQAEQKFGKENLPHEMQKCVEKGEYDKEFTFIHHVMPMKDFKGMGGTYSKDDQNEMFAADMAFASVYQSEKDKKIVQQRGYEEMPYFCLRWSRWGTENQAWGCSPAWEVLADARQINDFVMNYQALVEQKAFPRIIVPDSINGAVEMAAGEATVVKAEDMARGVKPEEWLTSGQVPELVEMIERTTADINEAFFVDIFKGLSQLKEKITEATYGAIALLQGENLDQFTGTFDQYRTELINLLVRRSIGIAYRGGLLREPPDSLMVATSKDPKAPKQLAAPKLNIKSRVTLALSQAKLVGTEKTLQMFGELMQARPEIGDNFDWNDMTRTVSRGNGMPESNLLPLKDALAKQQARVQMQQQEMKLRAAEIAAKSAGALGKAPPAFQSMAGGLLEQGSQQPQSA
jgi:Bacteriophage head to tail connecting protein